MKTFTSLGAFARHLETLIPTEVEAEHVALKKVGKLLKAKVQHKFGEYQPAAGDFMAWAELADSTKADRLRQGFPEDEPLLRTGALRDSVGYTVGARQVDIGSNSDIAVYQELGTDRIPPRSTFGSAGVENAEKVMAIVGQAVVIALVGEDVFRGAIEIEAPSAAEPKEKA